MRIEGIREKFGIPKMIKWDKKKLPVKDKSMREAFRESKYIWMIVIVRLQTYLPTYSSIGYRKMYHF